MKKIEFNNAMSSYRRECRAVTTKKGCTFYHSELSRIDNKYKYLLGYIPHKFRPLNRPAIVSWKFASVLMEGKIGSKDLLFVKPKFN